MGRPGPYGCQISNSPLDAMPKDAVTTSYSSTPTSSIRQKMTNGNPTVINMPSSNDTKKGPSDYGDPYGIGTCYDGPDKEHDWQKID